MGKPKHDTLCWECEYAGGKDEKCPWASEFKPVPGWKAEPTKILKQSQTSKIKREYIESFDVYEYPMFELADAIKRGIVERAESRKHFSEGKTNGFIEKYKKTRKEQENE